MSVFRRGNIWWYKFTVQRVTFRESSHSRQKKVAEQAERRRRIEVESAGYGRRSQPKLVTFRSALRTFLDSKAPHWSPNTQRIEAANGDHLLSFFGGKLLTDITAEDVSRYQSERLRAGASPRTTNLEYSTLRAVLKRHRLWANLQPDVRVLRTSDDVGKALSTEDVGKLLAACRESRSRSLYVAVLLSVFTGLRNSELKGLRWNQIDFDESRLYVGKSKTKAGEGRPVELASKALDTLKTWKANFPKVQPEHYVFPSERYGLRGEEGYANGAALAYDIQPEKPITSWKSAWNTARTRASIQCRWHDLRHTYISLLGSDANSDQTIMALAGHVSARMMRRYSHISAERRREAIDGLDARLGKVA